LAQIGGRFGRHRALRPWPSAWKSRGCNDGDRLHETGFEPVFESRSRFRQQSRDVGGQVEVKRATRLKHAAVEGQIPRTDRTLSSFGSRYGCEERRRPHAAASWHAVTPLPPVRQAVTALSERLEDGREAGEETRSIVFANEVPETVTPSQSLRAATRPLTVSHSTQSFTSRDGRWIPLATV